MCLKSPIDYLHTAGPRNCCTRNKFVAARVYGSIIDRSGPEDPKPLILLREKGVISCTKYETTNQQKPYSSYYCKSCGVNYDGSTTKKV